MLDFYSSRVKYKSTCELFRNILILILVLIELPTTRIVVGHSLTALSQDDSDRGATAISLKNLHTGPVVQVNTPRVDLKTAGEQDSRPRPSNLATGVIKRVRPTTTATPRPVSSTPQPTSTESNKVQDEKHDETLSTDCMTRRNEILHKLQNTQSIGIVKTTHRTPSAHSIPSGFQRLKPKNDVLPTGPLNGTVRDEESEHVPQCTPSGRYEPIQCHKIGYCWCVNKFGQAIKNSAASADEKPECDSRLYESDSNDLLVVTGVSANRLKALLRGSGLSSSTAASSSDTLGANPTASGDLDALHSYPSGTSTITSSEFSEQSAGKASSRDSQDAEFNRRVSESPEPSLSLIPNECSMSRENAKERAEKLTDDSIWVPECDQSNEKLYAGMQCHKSRVCWCVDQITGLPLRTSEQLTMHAPINCTEIRGIVDTATAMFDHNDSTSSSSDRHQPNQQQQEYPTVTTFSGFSESCDAHMRVEFVKTLIDQFKHQLSEYVRSNPSLELPGRIASANPFRLNEIQVARWKFASMDLDQDDKLDDREWSRFKNNFKLVDSSEGIQELLKQQQPTNHLSFGPLGILRGQRRCWRDFLQYCGNGDLLSDEMISLPKWLSCTELPSRSKQISPSSDKSKSFDLESGLDNNYANSKAAAINRSKHKNPFLGILKPN